MTNEPEELSLLLDILGNRNRRRIIDLIREKPCFVTEISERLTISPKAVIDHLQMLEDANILAFRHDERRRKYYYLAHDLNIQVHMSTPKTGSYSPFVKRGSEVRYYVVKTLADDISSSGTHSQA